MKSKFEKNGFHFIMAGEVGHVYLLTNCSGEIVYVGRSVSVFAGTTQHVRERKIRFTEVYIKEIDKSLLSFFETVLITRLKPKYNKTDFLPPLMSFRDCFWLMKKYTNGDMESMEMFVEFYEERFGKIERNQYVSSDKWIELMLLFFEDYLQVSNVRELYKEIISV